MGMLYHLFIHPFNNLIMKTVSIITKTIRLFAMLFVLTVAGTSAYAQKTETTQTLAVNSPAAKSHINNPAVESSVAALDTISCMFHQVINNRPILSWRTGYIVLENGKIMMNNVAYPLSDASQLTGFIQNKFLSSNRKKIVKNKVIQVVLLQPTTAL